MGCSTAIARAPKARDIQKARFFPATFGWWRISYCGAGWRTPRRCSAVFWLLRTISACLPNSMTPRSGRNSAISRLVFPISPWCGRRFGWRRRENPFRARRKHRQERMFSAQTALRPRLRGAKQAGEQHGKWGSVRVAEIILQTKGLTKEFRGFVAVEDVNLKVRAGTIHALIGPNGAGKTTCFNLLTKFLQPTRGVIYYEGRDITRFAPASVARLGLVRSFQISAVFPHLSVLENVR